MSFNIQNVEKFEVLPNNQPNNNTYSFRGGTPIISINIPSQAKLLRPSSVRINGRLRVMSSARALPDVNNIKGAGALDIKIPSRVGVNACIQNLNIASEATNQTLESVRQYGRLVNHILSNTHSPDDFQGEKAITNLCSGLQDTTDNLIVQDTDFSIPLYCGMFKGGNPIPLSANGVNGLTINLELASDNQALTGADAGANAGAFYELSNISLSGDYLIPDDEGMKKLSVGGSGAFQYNSYSSLYSVINSSDATQTYNLANSNVLSIIHSFLPVSHSNSYGQNSFANGELLNRDAGGTYNQAVSLNKVSFSRGGVKLGFDYEMDVATNSQEGRPETQVNINALNAFSDFSKSSRFLNQPQLDGFGGRDLIPSLDKVDELNNPAPTGGLIETTSGRQTTQEIDVGVRNFIIGLALDRVSDVGVNFKGNSYSTRIQSTLDGNSPNAIFTYVLSKNVLQYSPNGIMVQS
tara:strand:- start:1796 stop:3193 length:1398 start_codon:yes stop_codon:yes gene_type:complete